MSIQLRTTKTAAKSAGELRQLRELARLYGIATHYIDTEGRRRWPTPEGLLAITRALGVALDGMKNISTALDERRYVLWQQTMDPVAVAWEGKSPKIGVRVAAAKGNSGVACELVLEALVARKKISRSDGGAYGRALPEPRRRPGQDLFGGGMA